MFKPFSTSAPRKLLSDVQREIDALPEAEQRQIYADLYGKDAKVMVETEDLLNGALDDLENELSVIPPQQRQCYDQALESCPAYARDQNFQLMFLRCHLFDAKKAAQRIVRYWDKKVQVWGAERAFHRLTEADFGEEDRRALELGGIRFLPDRDKAGRGVFVVDKTRFDQRVTHRSSMHKLCWWIHEVALENVDVQRSGIVYISGSPRRLSTLMEEDRKVDAVCLTLVREALPVRVVGIHHYVSSRVLEYVVPLLLFLFGGDMSRRYKVHKGDEETFLEELAEYGINADILPADTGGTSEFDYDSWLRQRLERANR